jgi:hypothetical protein
MSSVARTETAMTRKMWAVSPHLGRSIIANRPSDSYSRIGYASGELPHNRLLVRVTPINRVQDGSLDGQINDAQIEGAIDFSKDRERLRQIVLNYGRSAT